ncbi:TIGR02253 family HAD-type hydrolase [Pyrococcus abyssi]|uniref:Glyceraldehyde 3-phosphate phosphatase n=1 Tax=Pyrococcus abyssi (strain GE5 / Orsay) TaxID=272844 RepID=Q9UXZ7_PYRAB|nr:TIGR02253 family HAD-type hydrolase [Pyrococcus abyssi]CAB50615.1 Hydrolase, HAD family [Pyrococcus abyssi GE5]CCE71182.1 TPA: hydrolase related to 2-haloalkanoic acid dehalogenase [Pyrococcus abyssi GE5]
MVRAILFDLDETLISERPLVLFILPQVYEILAKRLNVSKSEAREIFLGEIERMRGRYEWHDWNYFFRRFSLPFKFEELILSYPEKITVLPGVRDTLEILREKYRLAIVTSGPRYQILKLKVSGLLDYFDAVITRDDVKAIKPNPKIFIAALERLKVEPNKAVMVGDSLEQDVLGAKALGIKTVWINQKGDNGYNLPDFEISSISELLEVLEDEGDI